ncbi:MAG: N-acetylneuraminate synthase family protein [Cytophagales bacterium]|nr:N-acetylneuraminate synthase family protein [Cytophagales bacterium]
MTGEDGSVVLIAEIGQAHEGSLGLAHSYIEALAKTGVDAAKFQVHIAEAESSAFEKFRINFSREDLTRFDYWKRMQFDVEEWAGLKRSCEDHGLEFLASPFSIAAFDLLEQIGVQRYKIGSGELTNSLLLDRISETRKEVILSSGLSSYAELEVATSILKKAGSPYSILQCTSSYPTSPEEWGLNALSEMRTRFQCPVGFSDHSGDIFACLAAAALGASAVEFHAVFDKRMFGPDTSSSIVIDDIKRLSEGIRQIEKALRSPVDKNRLERYGEIKSMFGKSLAVNKDLKMGHKMVVGDLESKKPAGMGIAAGDYQRVLGKTITRDVNRNSFLNETDLAN